VKGGSVGLLTMASASCHRRIQDVGVGATGAWVNLSIAFGEFSKTCRCYGCVGKTVAGGASTMAGT
jgi:hypothetical protein